jgi:hypothetical protein
MVPLFVTEVCDACDFGVTKEKLFRGFIVYGRYPTHVTCEEYVFRTRIDADRWRTAAGREDCTIREVYSLTPFQWHASRGTLQDVILADHIFEVFADHRFEPLPNRCFLGEGLPDATPPAESSEMDELPF